MKQKLLSSQAIYLLIIAITISFKSFSQGITLSESFDNFTFPPTGWTIKPLFGAGGQFWTRNTGAGAIAQPHSGAGDAAFRKGNGPALTQTLVTPMFDLSGRGTNAANVTFWIFRDTNFVTSLDTMNIWINNADSLLGAVKLGAVGRYNSTGNGWNQYTFAYPASFTGNTNYIIFEGKADPTNTRRMYIDDINWDVFPPLCSGTPNVGSIISTNNIICGGSGSSNLSLTSPITNASGISYQWQSSSTGTGPWSTVGTTATYITGTLSSTTYYQCVVTCSASGNYTTSVDTIIVSSNPAPVASVNPNVGSACPGSTVSVSASASGTGTISYSWSPSSGLNTTSGANVNATATAGQTIVFVVKATDSNGCSDTAQVRISGNNAPPKQPIQILNGGNDSICAGVTLVLRTGPGGGNTYSWSNGKITRNDTISPNSSSLYVATVTSPASGCSTNDSIYITVLPGTAPTITVNPNSLTYCVGGAPITFTASGGSTYSWTQSANGGLTSTTGSPVTASPTIGFGPGGNVATYIVTGTSGNCSNTATATVNLGSKPILNPSIYPLFGNTPLPSDTICSGTTVRLNAIPGGGANPWTYIWTPGNVTTRIDTITPTTNGTYTVIATSNQGCGMDTGSIIIVVNSKPHASFTYTVSGLAVTFTNTTSGGASAYNWSFGDGNNSANSNPINTYSAGGTYNVTLIAIGGLCGNDTLHQQISTSVGINNVAEAIKLNVYPNPTNESTNISFVMESSSAQITLLNTLGQTIMHKTVFAKANNNFAEKVSMTGLSNGVYYIQIKNDKQVATIKFVKE